MEQFRCNRILSTTLVNPFPGLDVSCEHPASFQRQHLTSVTPPLLGILNAATCPYVEGTRLGNSHRRGLDWAASNGEHAEIYTYASRPRAAADADMGAKERCGTKRIHPSPMAQRIYCLTKRPTPQKAESSARNGQADARCDDDASHSAGCTISNQRVPPWHIVGRQDIGPIGLLCSMKGAIEKVKSPPHRFSARCLSSSEAGC